ncbi:amidase [Fimbriiglobus ruber]|uniref:Glutamyl-tRNA(Gln) amidotransferase subunit A-like protein n=1 Tax=Fimbriiglobus ruber TaxID=1908690 RepID=A0A225DDY0_9BACT|nr:amidase [Fimbriiglobus ruber]OWK34605.1 Glutamyl-tRNA(Gln) amidotransferase subunit A-like protein [Fimbriiglobus ruber]
MTDVPQSPDRRQLFRAVAALGIGSAAFHRAATVQAARVAATAPANPVSVTAEMIEEAEWVAGIELTDDERTAVANSLTQTLRGVEIARTVSLPNSVAPAIQFNPAPGLPPYTGPRGKVEPPGIDLKKPAGDDDLAFLPLASLAHLVRTKQVSSSELTKLALNRLKKYDPVLLCVVSLTEELALKQAKKADEEIAVGKYRGPLHGIPWGAKDLISYPGYKTTWGAAHFQNQSLDTTATVARLLEEAGAVLTAKLTLGALAMGDEWFGGRTRNPWDVKQGSSGSSAGSAAAVAAGLVGFAIGSETLGSIVSPSTRCGVTGLRPTFGRVSRHGCMALTWTMDKLGPLARSVEDCALVFGTIHGADAHDPTTVDRPFNWPCKTPLKDLRVGYVGEKKDEDNRAELKVLRDLGVKLIPIELPDSLPVNALTMILDVECAAAFDDLTRQGVRDGIGARWGTTFRKGQFITAVDYLRANRLRSLLMQDMAKVMEKVDVYVGGNDLVITNLTGHPTVCLPNGTTKAGTALRPKALTFTGRLYGESELLAVAHAYQIATGHHLKRPPMDKVTKENAGL